MVKLRLKQIGKKNEKQYRIVAADSKEKRSGKVLEIIGHYNPLPQKSIMTMKIDSAEAWIKNGAQMTERVEKIYKLIKENKVEK